MDRPKPNYRPPTDKCWTCGEPHEGLGHNCVAALKAKVGRLTVAYEELKEQAINAGLTVRHINL